MSSATFKIDLERTEIAKGAGAAVQTAGKDYVLLPVNFVSFVSFVSLSLI